MKGKIPLTNKIELESEESQWRMLTSGLITELKTSGIVNSCDGRRVRIKFLIKTILPPELHISRNKTLVHSELNEEISTGYSRIHEHLNEMLFKETWIFHGYINNDQKKPIVIIHFPLLKQSIYSQKMEKEELENFVPSHHLN